MVQPTQRKPQELVAKLSLREGCQTADGRASIVYVSGSNERMYVLPMLLKLYYPIGSLEITNKSYSVT